MDFAGLGDKFKSGDLGFLYGVLSQAQVSGSVTNVATLNFPVHGFQESFAYLFFSPRRRCTSARACPPRLAWTG